MPAKRHDSVRVLQQNVDLLAAMLSLAADSPTKAVWIEGFGVVKGAVVIELDGGNRRQSVKQGMLTALQALVDVSGKEPQLRSMAAVRGVERGNEQVIYGFLSAARAVDVTLRIRSAAVEEIAASKAPQLEISLIGDDAPPQQEQTKTSESSPEEKVAVESDGVRKKKSEKVDAKSEPQTFTWGDLAAESAETDAQSATKPESSTAQSTSRAGDRNEQPKATTGGGMSWGDLAQQSAAEGAATSPADRTPNESWAAVAAMSEKSAAKRLSANDLSRGDILEHPTLGECKILSILGEERIMVRPESGPSRKLTLRVFEIVATEKKGRYELRKRKR